MTSPLSAAEWTPGNSPSARLVCAFPRYELREAGTATPKPAIILAYR